MVEGYGLTKLCSNMSLFKSFTRASLPTGRKLFNTHAATLRSRDQESVQVYQHPASAVDLQQWRAQTSTAASEQRHVSSGTADPETEIVSEPNPGGDHEDEIFIM